MQLQFIIQATIFVLVTLGCFFTGGTGEENALNPLPCIPRDFDRGSVVCVCNATYCDLPGKLYVLEERTLETPVQVYTSTKTGLRLHKSTGAFSRTFSTFTISPTTIYDHKIEKRSVQDFLYRILGMGTSSRNSASARSYPDTVPTASIRVMKRKQFQKIVGFGGSFTDSAGQNIRKLSGSSQKKLMESYFSPIGSDYSLGRVPIGGSDFSPRPYTYDDNPYNKPDFNLTHFSLQPEDFNFKIPFIHWAQALRGGRPLRLVASPWSAPVWMKTNRRLNGAGMLRREFYQVWADYFVKFIEAYADNAIDIWGITTGNEPLNGFVPAFPFNCMGWAPADASRWIGENLGPTLQAKFPNQKIQIITVDDSKLMLSSWGRIVLDPNRSSSAYIDGVGTHWYFDFLIPNDALTQFHKMHPHQFLLSTEACLGFLPWEVERVILGSWERGETYLGAIIKDMKNWVSGWIDWNLALDLEGGPNWAGYRADAAILVNPKEDEFFKQPIHYAIAHVSKFVPPDSIRVGLKAKSLPEDVHAVAFLRPDGGTVIVLINKGSKSVKITLHDDEKKGNYLFKLPARGMQTIVYW